MANSSDINDVEVGFLKVKFLNDSSKRNLIASTTKKLIHLIKQSGILNMPACVEESVPANTEDMKRKLEEWCDDLRLDVIFTVGGVGCSSADVTPEAARLVIDKELTALSVAMVTATLRVTSLVSLLRPLCGMRGKSLIVTLPSNAVAAEACLKSILPIIPHAIASFRESFTQQDTDILEQSTDSSTEGLPDAVLEEAKELGGGVSAMDHNLEVYLPSNSHSLGESQDALSLPPSPCTSDVTGTPLPLDPSSPCHGQLPNTMDIQPGDILPLNPPTSPPSQPPSVGVEHSLGLMSPGSVCSASKFPREGEDCLVADSAEMDSVKALAERHEAEDAEVLEVAAAVVDLVSHSDEDMELPDSGLELAGEQMLQELDNSASTSKEPQEEGDNSASLGASAVDIYDFLDEGDQRSQDPTFHSDAVSKPALAPPRGNGRSDNVESGASTQQPCSGQDQENVQSVGCQPPQVVPAAIKKAKIHRQDDGEVLLVKVGTSFKDFLRTHPAICGIYLNRGKRDVKRVLVTLQRQQGAVDVGSWQRGGRVHDRNRLDDFFVPTEAGLKKQAMIQQRLARDEYVVNWYLWCPGRGNCRRKCGGYGKCAAGCPGMAHKQDRHNCTFMINLKLFLSDLTSWRVHITGCHVPTESHLHWVPPRSENERINEDTRDVILSTVEGIRSTPSHIQEVLKNSPSSSDAIMSKRRICRFVSSMKKRRRKRKYDMHQEGSDHSESASSLATRSTDSNSDCSDKTYSSNSTLEASLVAAGNSFGQPVSYVLPASSSTATAVRMVTGEVEAEPGVSMALYHIIDPTGNVSLYTISPSPAAPSPHTPQAGVRLGGRGTPGGMQVLYPPQPLEEVDLTAMSDSQTVMPGELGTMILGAQPQ